MTEGRLLLYRWANCDKLCARANGDISTYQSRLDEARDITGLAYDGMPKGSDISKPTEQKALAVLQLEAQYSQHIEYLARQVAQTLFIRREVDRVLRQLSPAFTEMAIKRYAQGWTWVKISQSMYMSETRLSQMDAELVKKVERIMVN